MTRDEAARAIGVAATEINRAERTEHGVAVVMSNGAHRLITDDGVFATGDHPGNGHLRRWTPPDLDPEPTGDDDRDPDLQEPGGKSDGSENPSGATGDGDLVVPDGSADQVMEWVGDDPERARAALDHEQAKAGPRKGLLEKLAKVTS